MLKKWMPFLGCFTLIVSISLSSARADVTPLNASENDLKLQTLPVELILEITEYLDVSSLSKLMATSRAFKLLGEQSYQWKDESLDKILKKFRHVNLNRKFTDVESKKINESFQRLERERIEEISWRELYILFVKLECDVEKCMAILEPTTHARLALNAAIPTLVNSVSYGMIAVPTTFLIGLAQQTAGLAAISVSGLILPFSPLTAVQAAGAGAFAIMVGTALEVSSVSLMPAGSLIAGYGSYARKRYERARNLTWEFKKTTWNELQERFGNDPSLSYWIENFNPIYY